MSLRITYAIFLIYQKRNYIMKKTYLLFSAIVTLVTFNSAFSAAPIAGCDQEVCADVVQWKIQTDNDKRGFEVRCYHDGTSTAPKKVNIYCTDSRVIISSEKTREDAFEFLVTNNGFSTLHLSVTSINCTRPPGDTAATEATYEKCTVR
jgi:hypothetical protein